MKASTVKLWVINLDRRPDRLSRMAAQLSDLNLSFEKITAVDALNQEGESVVNGLLTASYSANWRSHQMALKAIGHQIEGFGLVLEDDAVLNPKINWPFMLEECARYMEQEEVDFLQLGFISPIYRLSTPRGVLDLVLALRSKRLVRSKKLGRWLVENETRAGAHAYLVRKPFAEALVGLNLPPALATDPFYEALSKNGHRAKFLRLFNSIAEQESRAQLKQFLDSDLE